MLSKGSFSRQNGLCTEQAGGPAKPVLQCEILCRNIPTRPGPAACPACHSSGSRSCLGHFNQGPAHNDPRGHSFTEEGNRREGRREGAALGAVVELRRRTAGPAEQWQEQPPPVHVCFPSQSCAGATHCDRIRLALSGSLWVT